MCLALCFADFWILVTPVCVVLYRLHSEVIAYCPAVGMGVWNIPSTSRHRHLTSCQDPESAGRILRGNTCYGAQHQK